MSWQSDYNLVVSDNPKGKTDLLDMVGWITMRNQSGKTFENAQHQAAGRRCEQDSGRHRGRPRLCAR